MENMNQLNNLIEKLEKLEIEFQQSTLRIINAGNKKIYTMDLLSTAVNNRALQLTKGCIPSTIYIFEGFQIFGKSSCILLIGWSLIRLRTSLSH